MRTGKVKITLVLSAILMLVLLCDAVMAIPMPPHRFYGNVTINGEPAPDGTVLSARIGDVEYANTATLNGKYDFKVSTDDEDTAPKEGGIDGDEIIFYVNNEPAANATFSVGRITQLDLKIGEEQGQEPEEPVATTGFLKPVILAVIVVFVVAIVSVFIIMRKRKG